MADADYVKAKYPYGKADLYAAFLERGLDLSRPGGMSALLTMRNWMFLGQYQALREHLLDTYDLRTVADLGTGAFSSRSMDDVISAAMTVWRCDAPASVTSVALQAAPRVDKERDSGKPDRRRAALWCEAGRFEFDTRGFGVIRGKPLVYQWSSRELAAYNALPKFGLSYPSRAGMATQDNPRYLRMAWEPHAGAVRPPRRDGWVPFITGGKGREWIEPVLNVLKWHSNGIEMKVRHDFAYQSVSKYIPSEAMYFQMGVAFCTTGSMFSARMHRVPSVFSNVGSTVFAGESNAYILCLMNTGAARRLLSDLNPSIHFELSDIARLPLFPIKDAPTIVGTLNRAFTEHEAARETSVEFVAPGRSPWRYAQAWAQRAVDREPGTPLPSYEPTHDPPTPEAFVSHAFGLAVGRFPLDGLSAENTRTSTAPLPHGILFLSAASERDALAHPACAPLLAAWKEHGAAAGKGADLRGWLQKSFFAHHKDVYENRPIYFPLSSAKKSFVAWVSIHRFRDDTLPTLLAEHLLPELRTLDGEIADLNKARSSADKSGRGKAEKRYADVQKLRAELDDFIAAVSRIAEEGPPPTDDKCPKREASARFVMDLDDGVMVNSAALWPLLDPQWKDPKKWWKELATAMGRKDYDWAHLAARYFPGRVAGKCREDPSLAVAHGCFWRLFPEKAFAWELRLQDEIRPGFTIDEADSDEHRRVFLEDHGEKVEELRAAERARRARKARKLGEEEQGALPFGDEEHDPGEGEG